MNFRKIYTIDKYCKYPSGEIHKDYSCTLNQTVISKNKNKFYIMQLIALNEYFILFIRYGRIGEIGKLKYYTFSTIHGAIERYEKQFKIKTKNYWTNKDKFEKVDGKYFLADTGYDIVDNISTKVNSATISTKLDNRVQFLINLISNADIINKALVDLNIDTEKLPLGKISATQISYAHEILNDIDSAVTNYGDAHLNEKYNEFLMDQSSKFYTLVPYSCGRKKLPIIKNKTLIANNRDMLNELSSIVESANVINISKERSDKHLCDAIYDNLNTKITPLEKTSRMWDVIVDYINNTHGPTHKFKIELLGIYELERPTVKIDNNIDNIQLLWHGSRMANFCSIFKNGLILNPEKLGAVITGKMFGQGIYLTNVFSKSVGYTGYETSDNIGAILLCETSLGNQFQKVQADHTITLNTLKQNSYHSVHGKGKYYPKNYITINGVKIPNYELTESKSETSLIYDEMVIYNTDQLKIKYLVLVKKV